VTTEIKRKRGLRDDSGNAVVEFALVTPILLIVVLAVVQVILALHVRSTLTAAAAEGARAAALAGSSLAVGERRTRDVLDDAIGGGAATSVVASRTRVEQVPVIRVQVTARLPLLGMLGPETLVIEGHAIVERE
jgi:Flp pilus assembly protein TadG